MDNMSNNTSTSSSWDLEISMGNQDFLFDHHPPLDLVPPVPMPALHLVAAPPTHAHPPRFIFPDSSSGAANTAGGAGHSAAEDEEEEEEEALGAMKEMMYRIAAMQPVDIDPSTIKKPKRRNVRISDDPQSVAARHRRERISERIRILQRLVPGGTKMDTASMLEEAISYVKYLKRQVQLLQANPPSPPPAQPQLAHLSPELIFVGAHAAAPAAAETRGGAGPVLLDWAPQVSLATDHAMPGTSSSNSSEIAPLALGFSFDDPAAIDHQRLNFDFKR